MLGFLGDLLGLNQGDPAIDAANRNRDVLQGYKNEGYGLIDAGANKASGYLGQANDLWSGITGLGQKGANLYADALGLNGATGTANAQSAFTSSPGYQFSLDQGLQALDRSAAARGSFQSGGTGIDEMKYATGLASQDYNNWLGNLGGYNNMWTTGVTGQSGALGDLASLYSGADGAKTDLLGNVTSGYLDANNSQASGESANKKGLSNLFGNVVGLATGGWF